MNHPADDIETPRAFERMLRDAGFSRSRAKAITAKGFKPAKVLDPSISELVETIKCRQEELEKKAVSKSVQVREGQTVKARLFYSIAKEHVTVEVRPRDPDISFNAKVEYHFWAEDGPRPREETLYGDGSKGFFKTRLRVRDNDADWVEWIFGGPRGSLVKMMDVEIEALQGSTTYDIRISRG